MFHYASLVLGAVVVVCVLGMLASAGPMRQRLWTKFRLAAGVAVAGVAAAMFTAWVWSRATDGESAAIGETLFCAAVVAYVAGDVLVQRTGRGSKKAAFLVFALASALLGAAATWVDFELMGVLWGAMAVALVGVPLLRATAKDAPRDLRMPMLLHALVLSAAFAVAAGGVHTSVTWELLVAPPLIYAGHAGILREQISGSSTATRLVGAPALMLGLLVLASGV